METTSFRFSFVDTSGNEKPVIQQFDHSDGIPPWDEVIGEFLEFLGTVYGYPIKGAVNLA